MFASFTQNHTGASCEGEQSRRCFQSLVHQVSCLIPNRHRENTPNLICDSQAGDIAGLPEHDVVAALCQRFSVAEMTAGLAFLQQQGLVNTSGVKRPLMLSKNFAEHMEVMQLTCCLAPVASSTRSAIPLLCLPCLITLTRALPGPSRSQAAPGPAASKEAQPTSSLHLQLARLPCCDLQASKCWSYASCIPDLTWACSPFQPLMLPCLHAR